MNEAEHTIVIAGAGPTGLALGAELKRLGISSLILDRLRNAVISIVGQIPFAQHRIAERLSELDNA